ncbi:sporulation initiation factor Spo0A C-terminal domain-containing protein [bacterium]|jgi:hypothetical protein|nr:sporulation initiation factor Spo0A C-terminal domain-containing protein [bacterium]
MSDGDIPNFDEDPTTDSVYSQYWRKRTDLNRYSKESLEEFESHFEFGLMDLVQPCGVTHRIVDQFQVNYKERHDIGILIEILKANPVYGVSEISDEIIRLLEKTRIKSVSTKVYETEKMHNQVKEEFSRINPKKGEVESAYMEVAKKFETTPANVRTIIRRAIDKGWEGDLNPFGDEHQRLHIINRSKRDRT